MSGSNLTAFSYIAEGSEATPGLWNGIFSTLSQNIAEANSSNISSLLSTVGVVTLNAASNVTDYIKFHDTSALRSDYLLGSFTTGTADGLNIYDVSGQTMIVSFSKQSVRFYQQVVGPVFDVGGALASTYNAATFGGSTVTVQIQAAISQASIDGVKRVYVPASMYPYDPRQLSFDTRVQMVREGGAWDVYDVQAYGAIPNLTKPNAWSTTAIQAALHGANGAGGGIVYVPPGQYGISSITVPRKVTLRGAGGGRYLDGTVVTQLYQNDSTITTVVFLRDQGGGGVTVENLQIGAATATNGGGLRIAGMTFCQLRDVGISGTSGFALQVEGGNDTNMNAVQDCTITMTSVGTAIDVEGGPSGMDSFYMTGCYVSCDNPTAFVSIKSTVSGIAPDSPLFTNNRFISTSTTTALYGLMTNARFIGNRFESVAGGLNVTLAPPAGGQACAKFIGNSWAITGGLLTWVDGVPPSDRWNETSAWGDFNIVTGLALNPSYGFGSEASLGFFRSAVSTVGLTGGSLALPVGSAATPSLNFSSESSLGWYRSGTSAMALSYGSLVLGTGAELQLSEANSMPGRMWSAAGETFISANRKVNLAQDNTAKASWLIELNANPGVGDGVVISHSSAGQGGATRLSLLSGGQLTVPAGLGVHPAYGFTSEASLGLYRSGASTLATSYGTFLANGPVWSSGISVGPGGTLIPAISSMSSLVGAFVVQGSASSFTGIAWTGVAIGDIIVTGVFQGGAASSISSGLVPHSLVTVANQIEFRLSNVSTLVQNQSAQTWVFTRIRPF